MATLILDADNSLSSIGSAAEIEKHFGVPPVKLTSGFVSRVKGKIGVLDVMRKLFVGRTIVEKHPLFGDFEQLVLEPTPMAQELKLGCLVLDTFSHCVKQEMRELTRTEQGVLRQMEMQDWGKLGRDGEDLITKCNLLPIPVIFNSHISTDKDSNTGKFMFFPQIQGSMKENIQQYFDIILFTVIRPTKTGGRQYNWLTAPTDSRFAKDRKGVLEAEMPQDFSIIFDKYKTLGILNPKILVIGESGTGKSKALSTIKL